MDYSITTGDGQAQQNYTKGDSLLVNIYTSLTITQGSWWFNPAFGLRDRGPLKNTEATARLVKQDCQQALQWLLDNGRASSIVIDTERDRSRDLNRLKLLVTATQADGRQVTFDKFIEVV